MKVQQISIFLENRAGRLSAVTRLLGDAGVNIRALSLADTSDFGILRLIVDKPDVASSILRQNNFTLNLTDVVAIEIPDEPGGLANVLQILENANVNVEYMYAFVEKATDRAIVIFRFDKLDKVLEELVKGAIKNGELKIMTREELLKL